MTYMKARDDEKGGRRMLAFERNKRYILYERPPPTSSQPLAARSETRQPAGPIVGAGRLGGRGNRRDLSGAQPRRTSRTPNHSSSLFIHALLCVLIEKEVLLRHHIYILYNNFINNQYLNVKFNKYVFQNVICSINSRLKITNYI